MPDANALIDIADVLHSTAENGEVRVNLGNVQTGAGYSLSAPVWGPDGYLARPNDPADGAARALYMTDGHNRHVIGTADYRFTPQAGTLEPGDRMIVTDGPTRFYMKKAEAQVGLYTEATDEPAVGGKGMILDLSGSDGTIQLRFGGTLIVLDGSTVTILAAGATSQSSIVMTDTTITLTAGTVNIAGGFVCLGLNSDGTLPGKPGLDTVTVGALGQAAVASPRVFAANY